MRNYERDSYGEPRKVTCNQCGRVIVKQNGILREDVCCIQKKWGYFSKKMERFIPLFCVKRVMIGLSRDFKFQLLLRQRRSLCN